MIIPFLMFKILLGFALCMIFSVYPASASTSGSVKEIIANEEMQIYVYDLKEVPLPDPQNANKQVDVELIIKNVEPNARIFNIFFVRMIDDKGKEYMADPLRYSILPVRIPPNDILNGKLTFVMPANAVPSLLIWEEPDTSKLTVDLIKAKEPGDPVLESDWILTSNKGKTLADGRSVLTIHDDLMSVSPKVYAIEISIKNTSNEIIHYSPSYAFVKDDKGHMYQSDLQNINVLKNPLLNGELKPGESVKGMILFSLPDDVIKLMFIYDEKIGKGSYFAVPEFPIVILVLTSTVFVAMLMKLYARQMME